MTTTNLVLVELASNQSQPDVTHNQALGQLDNIIAGNLIHNIASDADYTLATGSTPPEWEYGIINITDTGVVLTTGRNIICPTNKKLYIFKNDTAQTLTFKTSAGTGIAVATTKTAIVYCDGTNVIRITADA